MRDSDWLITWNPDGETARVLLNFGEAMDSEIRIPKQKLAAAGKSDFALKAVMIARGNASRRLEFNVWRPHATGAQSWTASLEALAADPWGEKGILRVQHKEGGSKDYTASLLSSRHRPSFQDGFIDSVHQYVFRVTPI